jgi:hypothetical protein
MSDEAGPTRGVSEQPSERAPGLALKRWSAPKVIASSFGSTGLGGRRAADTPLGLRGNIGPIS